jgi:hypothetical protein
MLNAKMLDFLQIEKFPNLIDFGFQKFLKIQKSLTLAFNPIWPVLVPQRHHPHKIDCHI